MNRKIVFLGFAIIFAMILLTGGCYSCHSYHDFWGSTPVQPGSEELWFFDGDCKPMVAKKPAPKPVAKPIAKPKPAPVAQKAEGPCGPSSVVRVYPGNNVVKIDKQMPTEVQLNAPFSYTIKVTNLSDYLVTDIVVTEQTAANFKLESATPAAQVSGNTLVWVMPELEPGQSETIIVKGMAISTDCITNCATIKYTVPACANVAVVEPKLQLAKTAPAEVLLCSNIPIKITVTNTGTGDAKNVKVTDNLPAGLKTTDGKTSLTMDAGTLKAGESKSYTLTAKAAKTGSYTNTATASSEGGLIAKAATTTIVRQPVLSIVKRAPEKRYLGRDITYQITVSNNGDAPATSLIVEDKVPSGTAFVSASANGKNTSGTVAWNLGTVDPGQTKSVSMTVKPSAAGTINNTATAKATCAEMVKASASTVIAGIPAVLLEVIDVHDPIEIGKTETYVITATNQGTAVGTNIKIECILESNMSYASSEGPTRATVTGSKITFAPLPKLAPKAKATWKLNVKALSEGDVRFKVIMNTDQTGRPVEETESTHLYE